MFVRSQGRCIVLILTWGSLCRQPEVRTRRDRPSQMRFLAQALHQWKSSCCMAQVKRKVLHDFLHDSCSYILVCDLVISCWELRLKLSVSLFQLSKAWACPKDHIPDVFQAVGVDIPADAEDEADVRRYMNSLGCFGTSWNPYRLHQVPVFLICLERVLDDHDIWLSMCKRGVTLHGRSGGGWRQVCKGCWIRWEELWCFLEFLQSWWLQLRWFDHVWLL